MIEIKTNEVGNYRILSLISNKLKAILVGNKLESLKFKDFQPTLLP
jgi:hypothetical protein